MKAGEQQLTVHESDLDQALVAGAYLDQGSGNAFEGRPNTLVVLRATERGLGLLAKQVEALIGRGFHALVVSLGASERLQKPDAAATALKAAVDYADRFGGWLVVEAKDGVRRQLEPLGTTLAFVKDRPDALAAFRRREAEVEGGVDPLLVESGQSTGSADATSDPNDWGWGTAEATQVLEKGGLQRPTVDAAELLVEADELARLRDKVDQIVRRGKKYVTLRLHFKRDRRMTSDDLQALVAARDRLARAGGQLVLAALQEDLLKWLKLLDEDRHFLIVDSADDAEKAHLAHSLGEAPTTAPAAAEPAFAIVARDARSVSVRPRDFLKRPTVRTTSAPARILVLAREGLPGLAKRVERLAGEGVRDVVADLKRFADIRGERFDAVPPVLEAARKAGARVAFANVAREVKALLKILGVTDANGGMDLLADTLDGALLHLAASRHAQGAFEELRLETTSEELLAPPAPDPISSVELEEAAEPAPASGASTAEVAALRAQLAQAAKRADASEAQREAAQKRARELEAAAQETQRRASDAAQAQAKAEREAREARGLLEAAQRDAAKAQELAKRHERELTERHTQVLSGAQAEARAKDATAKLAERDLALAAVEAELAELQGRAQELEAASYKAKQLATQLAERDAKLAGLEGQVKTLDGQLKTLDGQLKARVGAAGAADASASKALEAATSKAKQLEAQVAERDRRVAALEASVAAAKAGKGKTETGADDAGLKQRVAELEREKARILTEAEQEIARLTREHEQLREELESAGEMIERLGKELEFS